MPIPYPGQLAALATASSWVVSSLAFDRATRRVGPIAVNMLRTTTGGVLLIALCAVIRGLPFPSDATPRAWVLLGLSGLLGFTFGDYCLFRSYLYLGPRLADDVLAAIEALNGDYPLHARAARALAEEYFDSDKVLGRLLERIGAVP